jgi:hypothetical protein
MGRLSGIRGDDAGERERTGRYVYLTITPRRQSHRHKRIEKKEFFGIRRESKVLKRRRFPSLFSFGRRKLEV